MSLDRRDKKLNDSFHDDKSDNLEMHYNEQHIIPSSKIVLCRQLGSGEFGDVWQGVWRIDEAKEVSMKILLYIVTIFNWLIVYFS